MHRLTAVTVLVGLLSCAACGDSADQSDAAEQPPAPDIRTTEVTYEGGGVTMKGYLAYDAAIDGKRPGVLVVHEWWGHTDYARMRAEMLADLGYAALAVDMYGDGRTADHPDDAGAMAQELMGNIEAASARFNAALELLQNHETTNPEQLAAIGYCLGGGVVLEMARRGADLDGVVSFHGSVGPPESPTEPGSVNARMLVLVGADDPFIPADRLEEFKADLDSARAEYEVVVYEGVQHSFTNPAADSVGQKFDMPLAYDQAADRASWEAMKTFFDEIFSN